MKLHMYVYLRAKFDVSSIILTSFRHGGKWGGEGGVILPKNDPLKSPPRLELNQQELVLIHQYLIYLFIF